jgi:small multidrug resistance family-3 protein
VTVLRSILLFALAALAEIVGVFVAGSLAWGMAVDGFRPDRYDLLGAALCLAGVAVIMYAPRTS